MFKNMLQIWDKKLSVFAYGYIGTDSVEKMHLIFISSNF